MSREVYLDKCSLWIVQPDGGEIYFEGNKLSFNSTKDAKVSELSVEQQQRVEIVKAFYRGAKLLIMDEPTEVLTPQETVLELNNVSYTNQEGIKTLDNISLKVCAGEVLGIAGVDGNGQKELAEVITDLHVVPQEAYYFLKRTLHINL